MRKKYVFIFMILSLLFLSSCDFFSDESKIKFDEVENLLELSFGKDGTHSLIIEDIDLPASLKEVSLTWTSDKPDFLTKDGKVNPGKDDVEVTLSVELKYDSKTRNVTFKVVVQGVEKIKGSYTITFDSIGGSEVDSITVVEGTVITKPANPTKDGYNFLGWFEDEITKDEFVFSSMPNKDITLYARWEEIVVINTYTITFDSKGGSPVESITEEKGTVITKPVDPTKDGYTFLGWFEDALTNEEFIFSTIPKRNITLYAKWTLYLRDGIYIYFGEYPQTIKEDNVVISTEQDSRGYFLGSDGAYYAKVVASPYLSDYTFSDGKSVTNGVIYYFKVEPIKWRILNESSGEALILCESIIANKCYDYSSNYYNNYKESEIRAWLNDQFYSSAFTNLQKQLILTTEVDNSVYSTGYDPNPYACENTFDKVFLLSYREVTNSSYGFSSDSSAYGTARQKVTSDYSRATGAYITKSSSYYGNGDWWLRSPNSDSSDYARYVDCAGYVDYNFVNDSDYGVVPALKIKLN